MNSISSPHDRSADITQWDNAVKQDGKCYSDGLLVAKDDFSDYYIAMRYYAVAHFSKYIPVGSESLDIGFKASRGLSLFAFKNGGKYIVVAVNNSKAKRVIEPDINFKSAEITTTTQEKQLESSVVKDKKVEILPKSISTIIFE